MTTDCDRCGKPTENPSEAYGQMHGYVGPLYVCGECRIIPLTDHRRYYDEGWETLKARTEGKP